MATWPSTLPQAFLQGSYKETEEDLVISFKTEAGSPMSRLRCESNLLPFSGDMHMNATQKAAHKAFYKANCAEPFDFPDPDTGLPVSVIYVPGTQPQYSDTGQFDGDEMVWKVALSLAKVP